MILGRKKFARISKLNSRIWNRKYKRNRYRGGEIKRLSKAKWYQFENRGEKIRFHESHGIIIVGNLERINSTPENGSGLTFQYVMEKFGSPASQPDTPSIRSKRWWKVQKTIKWNTVRPLQTEYILLNKFVYSQKQRVKRGDVGDCFGLFSPRRRRFKQSLNIISIRIASRKDSTYRMKAPRSPDTAAWWNRASANGMPMRCCCKREKKN